MLQVYFLSWYVMVPLVENGVGEDPGAVSVKVGETEYVAIRGMTAILA